MAKTKTLLLLKDLVSIGWSELGALNQYANREELRSALSAAHSDAPATAAPVRDGYVLADDSPALHARAEALCSELMP
ncbi:hypothetical protein WPS_00760 [Vulcanimicrobium alpinum]|uniref:Uncharacterized protein n=1 Tax=Vulcanimicrobium alpinum TaxID=3016050 RepID=A0AAN2C789_UNVUL|nr:hypothetical protein WPS_00760 [Vulcanimicrobium alpinum]